MKISNFFAILSHPGNRIRSISLTQEAQKSLVSAFSENLKPFQDKTDVNYKDNPPLSERKYFANSKRKF